jgi:adenine-specific DNA-methyltransferase
MAGKKKKALRRAKQVETLTHEEATRKNLATAELAAVAERMEELDPVAPVSFSRSTSLAKGEIRPRDPDLDPQIIWNGARIRLSPIQTRQLQEAGEIEIGNAQLVWRGKDRQDWSDLVVQAPQLYIQEKVHPKAIIDDLIRRSKQTATEKHDAPDLFADFNGLDDPEARLEFYQHDQHWSNRMILGDSLLVMASLAEREHLRGQVQCIYIDPPYGIKFNSNWQVSALSRDVRDGKREDISRDPEQVKAFRDTWKDGIHSYLTYLRDRLTIARELLTDSGSIFVQIGDENVHRVRALMDEVFGSDNAVMQIPMRTAPGQTADFMAGVADYLIWYAKDRGAVKARPLYRERDAREMSNLYGQRDSFGNQFGLASLASASGGASTEFALEIAGKNYTPPRGRGWRTNRSGISRLAAADRLKGTATTAHFIRYPTDFPVTRLTNFWGDVMESTFAVQKWYVVQTSTRIVERAILLATDPGDLVIDPTCGSGTTAYIAEQWGRRWITIDTSRVALALARARIMGARYPYYYLADTPEGRAKEQDVSGKIQSDTSSHGDIRQGFVYERAPHITLKSIANNAEIDVIWETFQAQLEPTRAKLNAALRRSWEEWEIPREADPSWSDYIKGLHRAWWDDRTARQKKIDESIEKNAEVEFLYDRPYEDISHVRVAGPFTVESLSPHRVVPADEEELTDTLNAAKGKRRRSKLVTPPTDFAQIVLEHLRTAGVQQSAKKDAIKFMSLQGWPGEYIGAEGRFIEGETSGARRSSSVQNSAPSPASISSPRPARQPRRASTC